VICSWCNSRTGVVRLTPSFYERYPEIGEVNKLCAQCCDTAIDEINANRSEMDEPSEMTEWGDYDADC
jgi:hypothetical protein